MRKSTIWLLTVVMVFAFAGLLYLQVSYVGSIIKTYSAHFNETAKKCLNQVASTLGREEMRKYLEEDIQREARKYYRNSDDAQTWGEVISLSKFQLEITDTNGNVQTSAEFNFNAQRLSSKSLTPDGAHGIVGTSKNLQSNFVRRYLKQSELLNEVINDMLYSANLKPIEERVDFKQLGKYIETELKNNGLNLSFVFSVTNKDGNTIYRSDNGSDRPTVPDVFIQALFPNDPPSRLNFLRVYFPTKHSYINSQITFIVPSVIFSVLLLVTFTFTLYIVFRQKKLSEMKNDFINNMTHELKTPVSTISLAAQMLKDADITKNQDVFKHISSVINDETKRLNFLVEKVLQISLFERRQASLKLKEIDVNDLVTGIANTFALKVEKYGGSLDVDLRAENSGIYADEMHITNVLFNLMDNAVKYRRQDVPLRLMSRTWNEDGKLMLSVEDNGIGIKKEHLKKVFDRFYRIPTGNVHNVKGFGLGLAYVRKIVQDHKGTIRAENADTTGTKFIITLPLIKS
ncbi:Sensor histidine kinase YycG [Bacteroidales bacterium Barb7]|nr:Sensor histidine kinase YycG [Bacteroidales bacterium Barb7]